VFKKHTKKLIGHGFTLIHTDLKKVFMLLKKIKSGISGGVAGAKFYVDNDGVFITISI